MLTPPLRQQTRRDPALPILRPLRPRSAGLGGEKGKGGHGAALREGDAGSHAVAVEAEGDTGHSHGDFQPGTLPPHSPLSPARRGAAAVPTVRGCGAACGAGAARSGAGVGKDLAALSPLEITFALTRRVGGGDFSGAVG